MPESSPVADTNRPASGARIPLAALLVALPFVAWTLWLAREYLATRGFPLDDAWIHLVYGRSVAQEGSLAYNPGEPATGATSPAWAVLLGVLHVFASGPPVLATKLLGFALHLAAGVVFARALANTERPSLKDALGPALFLAAPSLVAASMSGMETGLSELGVALVLLATLRARALPLAFAGGIVTWIRPELALVAVAVPVLVERRIGRHAFVGLGGALAAFAISALRNLAIGERPLPATFYAKAADASLATRLHGLERTSRLFEAIPEVRLPLGVVVTCVLALVVLRRSDTSARGRSASALVLVGVLGSAVSCALIPPIDPPAFYHQRYVLPFVAAILAGAPGVWLDAIPRAHLSRLRPLVLALVAALFVDAALHAPARIAHLANDTRNIDEVQVAIGRRLAHARPAHTTWVVDAGASRYFGRGYFVDLMGLNSPAILDDRRARFLGAHRPSALEIVPGWAELRRERGAPWPMSRVATEHYTVTSSPIMARHFLVGCPPGKRGAIGLRTGWGTRFRCAGDATLGN